jgi:hypothetical protein
LARYEESANLAPDPTRLAIQRGCDFRAGELIAMAAELFTTDRPQPEGVSVADARRALSLEMHGGKTVLAALQGRANQLFTEIDNLRSQESSGHDLNKEVKRLKKDLQELKEEIAVELTPSSDPASVRLELDRPSFEPLRLSLEAAEQRVDALMESPAKFFTNERLVDELVDTRPLESFINQTGSERSENDQKQLDAILRGFKYLKTLIRGQLDTPPGRINLESRDVLSARRALNNQIVAMSHNSNLSGNDFHRFVGIVSPLGVIGDSIEVFDAEAGRLNALKGRLKHPPYQTSQYLALAASEHVSVESLMECHMRGVDPGLIELRSDHSALISQKTLGAGAINTVTLCQYKTAEGEPVDLVFKPEREARYGLAGIPISSLGYSPDARALDLNAAAYKAADAVGAGHTLCRTSAGTFEGHFGMFMELAPGQAGRAVFFNPNEESNPDSVLNRMVNSPQYPTIKANLMREMCKLEWADTLSGQVDRHTDNYLVDINTETGDVRVTGIDNDACFSHNMVGPGLVRYNGEIKDTFLLSKEEFKTVVPQQGINQVNRPQFIDKDTYDNLMSIDVDAYRESIKNHLNGDEQALESAVARLQNAQKYAKTLADQGRVVEDWESHQIDGQSLMQLYEAHNTAEVDRLGDNAGRSVGFFGQCLSSLQSAEQRLSARP